MTQFEKDIIAWVESELHKNKIDISRAKELFDKFRASEFYKATSSPTIFTFKEWLKQEFK